MLVLLAVWRRGGRVSETSRRLRAQRSSLTSGGAAAAVAVRSQDAHDRAAVLQVGEGVLVRALAGVWVVRRVCDGRLVDESAAAVPARHNSQHKQSRVLKMRGRGWATHSERKARIDVALTVPATVPCSEPPTQAMTV